MLPAIAGLTSQHERAPGLEQYLFARQLMRQLHDAGGTERDPDDDVREDRRVDVAGDTLTRLILRDDELIGPVRHEVVALEASSDLIRPGREIADAVQAASRELVPVAVELNPALAPDGVPRLRVDLSKQTLLRIRINVTRHVAESGNQS